MKQLKRVEVPNSDTVQVSPRMKSFLFIGAPKLNRDEKQK